MKQFSRKDIFYENLKKAAAVSSQKLSEILPKADVGNIYPCSTWKSEENLMEIKNGNKQYLHSPEGALEEAIKNFQKINSDETQIIYVYGIGLGYYYEAAKSWLEKDKNRCLVFFEDQIAILRKFMESERATAILDNSQTYLYYFNDFPDFQRIFLKLIYFFIPLNPEFISLPYYQKTKEKIFQKLRNFALPNSIKCNALTSEYLLGGEAFFKNFYQNALEIQHAYHGEKLYGKFHNIPCLICGAGPSLNKQKNILHSVKNKALIIGSGSSTQALSSMGIHPHLGVCVDPTPSQYLHLSEHHAYETPFIYQNRLHPKSLREIHGQRIFLNKPTGYPIADWLKEKIDLREETALQSGVSVTNFCISIAHALGCSPIILIGLDLSYSSEKKYAQGIPHLEGKDKPELFGNTWKGSTQSLDIHGNIVSTAWNWIVEKNWIEQFTKKHPNIALINASEQGLPIRGVENASLEEVCKKRLKKQLDLSNRLYGERIQLKNFSTLPISMACHIENLHKSMLRCIHKYKENLKTLSAIEEKIATGEVSKKNFEKYISQVSSDNSYNETASKYVLAPLQENYALILARNFHRIVREECSMSEKEFLSARIKLVIENFFFLLHAAKINTDAIENALKIQKSK